MALSSAASARFVQVSIDRTASLISGFGGTTEKPMKYDRGTREATSGSRDVGAHAIVAAAKGTVQPNTPADFTLMMESSQM